MARITEGASDKDQSSVSPPSQCTDITEPSLTSKAIGSVGHLDDTEHIGPINVT